jgi:hypothetical protein
VARRELERLLSPLRAGAAVIDVHSNRTRSIKIFDLKLESVSRKEKRREKRKREGRIEWGHVSSSERKFEPNLPPRRGCYFLLQEDVWSVWSTVTRGVLRLRLSTLTNPLRSRSARARLLASGRMSIVAASAFVRRTQDPLLRQCS